MNGLIIITTTVIIITPTTTTTTTTTTCPSDLHVRNQAKLEEAWSTAAAQLVVQRIGDSALADGSGSGGGNRQRSIDSRPFVRLLAGFVSDRMTRLRYAWWTHQPAEARLAEFGARQQAMPELGRLYRRLIDAAGSKNLEYYIKLPRKFLAG